MIEVLVVAVTAVVVLAGLLVMEMLMHSWERREWALERRALVDRAIARHSGEVIGLDRNAKPKPEREHEPRLIEGLN